MNRDEVKQILLLYRPGTTDAEDHEIAEALALAKNDPELMRWFEEHCARQIALREKFRQIPVLAGLKEQIISEEAAKTQAASRREKVIGAAAVAVILMSLVVLGIMFFPHRQVQAPPIPNTLANYEAQVSSIAVNGYYMDLMTNDAAQIQAYLATKRAPSDYTLPAGLQNVAMTGCAVESWKDSKVSMVCFKTGKPLAQYRYADLWLFVADSAAVKDVSTISPPKITQVNGFTTATWTQDGKLYVLGIQGDESAIKKYL